MNNQVDKPLLYVRTLGEFSLEFDGKRLPVSFRGHTQFALLLQTLLHHKEGTERSILVRTLFGDQELDDVAHSLRNSLYLAKKRLKEMGLPDVDYFRKQGDLYFWTDEIAVAEDADEFEQAFVSASKVRSPEKRFTQMLLAARLYTGRFLASSGEEAVWIAEEADRISALYERCLWEIQQGAVSQYRFEELYEVGKHAMEAEPYTSKEVFVLQALVGMNRLPEAEQLYNDTLRRYIKKFGGKSAKRVHLVEKAMGAHMLYKPEDISGIRERLATPKDQTRGGFVCEFPVFQELYRSVERVMIRFGGYIFLMLCTLVDAQGVPIEIHEETEPLSELLLDALVRSVRHSDTITRYGKGQFLVLLFGTSEENCSIVKNRIEADFAQVLAASAYADCGVCVDYSISKVISEKPGSFPFFEHVGQAPPG